MGPAAGGPAGTELAASAAGPEAVASASGLAVVGSAVALAVVASAAGPAGAELAAMASIGSEVMGSAAGAPAGAGPVAARPVAARAAAARAAAGATGRPGRFRGEAVPGGAGWPCRSGWACRSGCRRRAWLAASASRLWASTSCSAWGRDTSLARIAASTVTFMPAIAVLPGPLSATTGQKIAGHQGAGSQESAVESPPSAPARRSAASPAAARAPSLVPPR